jgi:hypothetical protein
LINNVVSSNKGVLIADMYNCVYKLWTFIPCLVSICQIVSEEKIKI